MEEFEEQCPKCHKKGVEKIDEEGFVGYRCNHCSHKWKQLKLTRMY